MALHPNEDGRRVPYVFDIEHARASLVKSMLDRLITEAVADYEAQPESRGVRGAVAFHLLGETQNNKYDDGVKLDLFYTDLGYTPMVWLATRYGTLWMCGDRDVWRLDDVVPSGYPNITPGTVWGKHDPIRNPACNKTVRWRRRVLIQLRQKYLEVVRFATYFQESNDRHRRYKAAMLDAGYEV